MRERKKEKGRKSYKEEEKEEIGREKWMTGRSLMLRSV